jgi:hypothetical protein
LNNAFLPFLKKVEIKTHLLATPPKYVTHNTPPFSHHVQDPKTKKTKKKQKKQKNKKKHTHKGKNFIASKPHNLAKPVRHCNLFKFLFFLARHI